MDIDSDFCIEKGPLVFKYLNDKYGKENCCNIITFSRLTTKMVIKDVSKALDIPFKEVNAFTAMLPSGPNDDITIDEILNDPKYNKLDFVKKHPRVFKFASKIVGCVRHAGQHAAGIAVTPMPVHEIAPVYYGREVDMPDGTVFKGNRSQLTREQAESCGIKILKMIVSLKVWKLLETPKVA